MEMGEINKIASRKRINVEVEKLREKVSKETAKIIKLKVAQDTAYWDLKEKLQQVEGNHERLQQNMVEVQMQHETISGQYQDELRLRPDTLNKLSSTREICEVLEDYGERLKETLSRCQADQAALCAAYQQAGGAVQQLARRRLGQDEHGRLLLDALQEKVRVANEHHGQLLQLFSAVREQADAEVRELKASLEKAVQGKEDLNNTVNELKQKLDLCNFDCEKKQETIANLQKDMKELLQEFNTRSAEANNTLLKQDNDLKKALETNDSLKTALSNQEEYTKTVFEENNALQEKLAALEEEKAVAAAAVQDLRDALQESANVNEHQKNEIARLIEEKERLGKKEMDEREGLILSYKEDISKLNEQIVSIDKEKCEIITNLNKTTQELNEKCKHIEELTADIECLNKKLEEIANEHKANRESLEEQIRDLMKTIEARDKELDSKAGTITHLMSELKISTDVRSKLETTLQKVKKEMEVERDHVKERERKMNENTIKLENDIKDKEDELSKQMSIILDMRNEKERLQDKIQGMQNTIDNIQKELTGRPRPARALTPDHDDNAVVLTPQRQKPQPSSPIIQKSVEFAAPRKDPKLDAMLYNLFSDSSVDGDNTLDATEVNWRFAAMSRGERVSPMPLSALKRRAHRQPQHDPISLSQVKNDINKGRSFFKNKRADNKTKNNK